MSNLDFFKGMLAQERSIFTRVVGAAVDGGLDYRPDPKSRSSRQIIEHLIGHNLDLVELIDDCVINHRIHVPFESVSDAVEKLDDSFETILGKLETLDDGSWMEPAEFVVGGNAIMEAPRQQLAWLLLMDAVHHRGQLSTHLRPMGSKVPSMYGPSADEQPGGA